MASWVSGFQHADCLSFLFFSLGNQKYDFLDDDDDDDDDVTDTENDFQSVSP